MVSIYCSNKLSTLIGKNNLNVHEDYSDPKFGHWNAHLFFLDKRKCLILINDKTLFAIFFIDILKKDFTNFQSLFKQRLTEQLTRDEIISKEEIHKIAPLYENISFTKTNGDRIVIGNMNDYIRNFKGMCFYRYDNVSQMDLVYENGLINTTPNKKIIDNQQIWSNPKERMIELLKNK